MEDRSRVVACAASSVSAACVGISSTYEQRCSSISRSASSGSHRPISTPVPPLSRTGKYPKTSPPTNPNSVATR